METLRKIDVFLYPKHYHSIKIDKTMGNWTTVVFSEEYFLRPNSSVKYNMENDVPLIVNNSVGNRQNMKKVAKIDSLKQINDFSYLK